MRNFLLCLQLLAIAAAPFAHADSKPERTVVKLRDERLELSRPTAVRQWNPSLRPAPRDIDLGKLVYPHPNRQNSPLPDDVAPDADKILLNSFRAFSECEKISVPSGANERTCTGPAAGKYMEAHLKGPDGKDLTEEEDLAAMLLRSKYTDPIFFRVLLEHFGVKEIECSPAGPSCRILYKENPVERNARKASAEELPPPENIQKKAD